MNLYNGLSWRACHDTSTPEDQEKLLVDSSSSQPMPHFIQPRRSVSSLVFLCTLVACSAFASIFGFIVGQSHPLNLDATCTAHTSKYSIVSQNVAVRYDTVQFNGSFERENIYRQDAGPEVDAAWEALGVRNRPIIVPEAEATASGLTPNHARRAARYGHGVPVFVESFHQLHCLNLLRKSLYFNYDHYRALGEMAFSEDDQTVRWHVTHCLDLLRQRLICQADTGTFGQLWVRHPHTPRLWPDFSTRHTCKNFDDIRAWAQRHQVEEQRPDDWYEQPGDGVRIWDEAP